MKKQVAKAKLLKKPSASSSALAVFKKTCKKCGHEFTGRAKKNVSYALRRHMREDHGIGEGGIAVETGTSGSPTEVQVLGLPR